MAEMTLENQSKMEADSDDDEGGNYSEHYYESYDHEDIEARQHQLEHVDIDYDEVKKEEEHKKKMMKIQRQMDEMDGLEAEIKRKEADERIKQEEEEEEEEHRKRMKQQDEELTSLSLSIQESVMDDIRQYEIDRKKRQKEIELEKDKMELTERQKIESERKQQIQLRINESENIEWPSLKQEETYIEEEKTKKLREEEKSRWNQQIQKKEKQRKLELKEQQKRLEKLRREKETEEKQRKHKLEQKIKMLQMQSLHNEELDQKRKQHIKNEEESLKIRREKELERQRQDDKEREREIENHKEKLKKIDNNLAAERERMQNFQSETTERMKRFHEETLRFAQMRNQAAAATVQNAMKQNYERGMKDAMAFMKEKMERAQKAEMNGLVVMYDKNESSRGISSVAGDMFRMAGFIVPPAVPLEGELPPTPPQCQLEWLVMYIVIDEESSSRTAVQKANQYLSHRVYRSCLKLVIIQILQQQRCVPQESLNCARTTLILTANPQYHKDVERELNVEKKNFKEVVTRLKSKAKRRADCFVHA